MKNTTPLKAIRAKCIDCSGDSKAEVKLCENVDCPLFPFRMETDPSRKQRGGKKTVTKPVARQGGSNA